MIAADQIAEFENRQEHTNRNAADCDAEENNQEWFDQ
jgi:hypothetical protein